jgi:GNAT superfamily N-acetyltransferase
MEATQVRSATLIDVPFLARHNQAMAMETENRILPDEIIIPGVEAVLKDPSKGFYIVATLNGEVVGNLMITYEWSDWRNGTIWWIQSVYVRPEHRGKGIFRLLFDHIAQLAAAANSPEIRLYAEVENENAHGVYESLGMSRSHYVMYEMKVK